MSAANGEARFPGSRVALVGGVLGVVVGGAGLVALVRAQADDPDTGAVWGLALGLAMLAPFVMALIGLRRPGSVVVPGAWLGAGVAGLLFVMSSPAGAGLIFLPSAVLLLVGGAMAWRGAALIGTTVLGGCVIASVATLVSLYARSRAVSLVLLISVLAVWILLFVVVLRSDGTRASAR